MGLMEQFIDKLKEHITKSNKPQVQIVDNSLVYNLSRKISRNISSYNQEVLGELGRASVICHLIENGIPANKIYLEQASDVGSPSKRLDVIINIDNSYNGRECVALVECKTSVNRISDSDFSNYCQRQLYNIAHSYAKDIKKRYPLVLIACEVSFDNGKINILFKWFHYPEIDKAKETGQISLDKIFCRSSSFAYDSLPKVSKGCIYFEKKPITKDDLIDIEKPSELQKLLKEKLHQGLRNYGITDEVAFDAIINLLLAKTFDEYNLVNSNNTEPDFQIRPEDYSNKVGFYNRIQSLYRNARVEFLDESINDCAKQPLLNHPDKEVILLDIVPFLQRIKIRSLRFLGKDSMGDVFLDFMHSIFRQERGLFFTHPNICRFVCNSLCLEEVRDGLKDDKYKSIIDPSCGSGTFLIEALRIIFKDYLVSKIKTDALKILYGIDNDNRATALCKVNMVIHGDGSAHIYTRDALGELASLPLNKISHDKIEKVQGGCTYEVLKDGSGFDIIMTNPPFSLEIRDEKCSHFVMSKYIPFRSRVTIASECLFLERWFQLLNSGGKIGVVLPASILDSSDYFNARLLMMCYFSIVGVIGLPDFAFRPYAQQKTYLVFGKRRNLDEANKLFQLLKANQIAQFVNEIKDEKIIFYEAKDIGFTRVVTDKTTVSKESVGNELNDSLAGVISEAFQGKYPQQDKFEGLNVVSIEQIFKRDSNLKLIPFYLQSSSNGIQLRKEKWQIVTKLKEYDGSDGFICETGDILRDGGIMIPKWKNGNKIYDIESRIVRQLIFKDTLCEGALEEVSVSARNRILSKIEQEKFVKLQEGDIIIAPVRPYLKKIAVVCGDAINFMFSKDFIVLRKDNVKLEEAFYVFLCLIDDRNKEQLESLCSTGKSGYPKISNKEAILDIVFDKVDVSQDKLEKVIKLISGIKYEEIVK